MSYVVQAPRERQEGEIGIEIEMEGRNLRPPSNINDWKPVEDGSLRGESIEWVLRRPLPRENVASSLTRLFRRLGENGATINKSDRTSVHVHLNMQGCTSEHLVNTIMLYYLVEPLMFGLCGAGRDANFYCVSNEAAPFLSEVVKSTVESDMNLQQVGLSDYRYAALNLASLTTFGSLEFRAMEGCSHPERIANWVERITDLKDIAGGFPGPYELSQALLSQDVVGFIRHYFPTLVKQTCAHDWEQRVQDLSYSVISIGALAEPVDNSQEEPVTVPSNIAVDTTEYRVQPPRSTHDDIPFPEAEPSWGRRAVQNQEITEEEIHERIRRRVFGGGDYESERIRTRNLFS